MTHEHHQIFLSYASPDKDRVMPFYESLRLQGFNVWIDCRSLLPGQNWDFEIRRAFDKSSFVIAFISSKSFERRGYVQRELKMALDRLAEKLVDDIYLIPVLLDDSIPLPDQLKSLQAIHASDVRSHEQIANAITHQLDQMGSDTQKIQSKEDVYWSSQIKKESWDGLPGYEIEMEFLDFNSAKYKNLSEICEFVRGNLLPSLFQHRADKLIQCPEIYNYGQDRYRRTNTFDAHCGEPRIKGKVLSIQYTIHWYGAGAAHPNHYYKTFSFVMEPLFLIASLQDIFLAREEALCVLKAEIRQQLYDKRIGDGSEENTFSLDPDWVDSGTNDWSHFDSFEFGENGLEVLFDPYQVAPYVCGPQFVEIPYDRFVKLMRVEYQCALQIENLAH